MPNPSAQLPDRPANALLRRLPKNEYEEVCSHRTFRSPVGHDLLRLPASSKTIYFPTRGVYAICHHTAEGRTVGVALVGNEGLIDLTEFGDDPESGMWIMPLMRDCNTDAMAAGVFRDAMQPSCVPRCDSSVRECVRREPDAVDRLQCHALGRTTLCEMPARDSRSRCAARSPVDARPTGRSLGRATRVDHRIREYPRTCGPDRTTSQADSRGGSRWFDGRGVRVLRRHQRALCPLSALSPIHCASSTHQRWHDLHASMSQCTGVHANRPPDR
jgi:hypothetical protein